MEGRCSSCAAPDRLFEVEGTGLVLCGACIHDQAAIGWAHEQLRRIHFAAHGYEDPCPTCAADPWLEAQRQAEAVEQQLERSRVEATFTADLDIRYPWR
jgi:hypothetical protein